MSDVTSLVRDLAVASSSAAKAPGVFSFEVPDGWQMGRSTFGGLTIAALVRAIEAYADDPTRTLRSITAELPGPALVGPAEIFVEPVRVGSGQSTIRAKLVQDGEVRTAGTAILARPRAIDAEDFCELVPPTLRAWSELAAVPVSFGGPVFTQHFEYRVDGALPFSGGAEASTQGWVRPRIAGPMSIGALLAAVADAWWPAVFSRDAGPRPVATISFTLQILGTPVVPEGDAPFAYRARTWARTEGWFVEQREVWSGEGRLLALNQQTFAVIK